MHTKEVHGRTSKYFKGYAVEVVELAWRSASVMDCHAAARGSIPGGNNVKTELHVLRKGQ